MLRPAIELTRVEGILLILRKYEKMIAPIKTSAIILVVCTAWSNEFFRTEKTDLPQTGAQITAIMKAMRAAVAAASVGVKIPPYMPARGVIKTPSGSNMMKPMTPDGTLGFGARL